MLTELGVLGQSQDLYTPRYWHNAVMDQHFPACDDHGPDVVGVAGQMAIYSLPTPLPPTPNSIFSYTPGAGLQEIQPNFQAISPRPLSTSVSSSALLKTCPARAPPCHTAG